MKKVVAFSTIILVLLFSLANAEEDYSDVDITASPLSGPVYVLFGKGGNIGVSAGEDGILIVDDQFAPLADKIEEELSHLGTGKPKFILNTHWHGDHTGGNAHFGEYGTIIAQDNVRKRLNSKQEVKLFHMKSDPQPKEALPVITFAHSLSVYFNGEEIKVIHFPHGHTDGDSVVIFTESNVVHTGDHFFNGMYPFVDLDSGGDVEGYIQNVAAIIDLIPDGAQIIPGHGPVATKADYQEFYQMLNETTEAVKVQMDAGKSLSDIQAAGLGDKIESRWGKGVLTTEQWINIIYTSYTNKA